MRTSFLGLVAATALMVGGSAFASEPLSVALGSTATLNISKRLKAATVEDPSVLTIKRVKGGHIMLQPKSLGRTTIKVQTRDGVSYEIEVHVLEKGSSLYTLAHTPSAPVNTQSTVVFSTASK